MRLVLPLTLLAMLTWGCATAPSVPPERPTVLPSVDSVPTASLRVLSLPSQNIIYEFRQSAEVRPEPSVDTAHTTITTEALLSVAVTTQGNSTHEITVSVDSVRITASGSPASRNQSLQSLPVFLGAVLRTFLGPETRTTQVLLPDSLCAYGHLVSAAQEVTLFPLPLTAPLGENAEWSDSSRFSTCRAGIIVETRGMHGVTYSGDRPNELGIHTATTVQGTGVMRTDSVTVSGTVRSSGKAHLERDNRLPVLLQTESLGTISVRLRDSTTVFRQQSSQEWRRRPPN